MGDRQISSTVTEVLRRQILDGTLPAGSRLPAERVLCEQLGVSRGALRVALQILKTNGLLESHVGRGTFVARDVSAGRSAVAAMNWLYLHRHDLEDLNEVRQILEPPAVQAIPKARASQVAAYARYIVENQAAAVRLGNLDEAAKLDAEFHSALIAEIPNAPLRVLTEQLIAMAAAHARSVYEVPGAAAHSVAQHEAIVAALEAGKIDLAARLVHDHAKTASRFALDRLKEARETS